MAISVRLEQKLLEVLGDEAGQEMVAWMRDIEARHAILYGWSTAHEIRARTELLTELRREIRTATEIAGLKIQTELLTGFERLRAARSS